MMKLNQRQNQQLGQKAENEARIKPEIIDSWNIFTTSVLIATW